MAASSLWSEVLAPVKKPEEFFSANGTLASDLRSSLKKIVDYSLNNNTKASKLSSVPELVKDGFDAEGLWAQLTLIQSPVLSYYTSVIENEKSNKNSEGTSPLLSSEDAHPPLSSRKGSRSKGSTQAGSSSKAVSKAVKKAAVEEDSGDEVSDERSAVSTDKKSAKTEGMRGKMGHTIHDDEEDEGGDDIDDEVDVDDIDEDDEGEDDQDKGSEFSFGDMEAFADEGDEEWGKIQAKISGKTITQHGDDEDEDEEEDEDDLSIDLNAPIPASDNEGGGEVEDIDMLRAGKSRLSVKEKKAKLAALLKRGPRYEDFFGPREQHGDAADGSSADDDEEEGSVESDEIEGDDADSFSSGNSDDRFIDEGLGVGDDGLDDESAGDNSAEEDDEMDGPSAAKRRRVRFGSEASDEDDASLDSSGERRSAHKLSRHQLEKQRMAEEIAALEEEAIAGKHWSQKGEIDANARPQNSLLEATLDYQQAVKLAPPVTIERTIGLEDLIKQRIVDSAFDDPERKEAPVAEKKKADVEVSTEKSTLGLGELYAADYEKQILGLKEDDPVLKSELEAKHLMQRLFRKLDALTNFFFTPKLPKDELNIKPSVPAVNLEEALPMAVSDAVTAAPEEIHARKKGRAAILKTAGEKSAAQRETERRAKKAARRNVLRSKAAAEKLAASTNPGLGNKHAKEHVLKQINSGSSDKTKIVLGGGVAGNKRAREERSGSAAFFSKLQSEARGAIDGGKPEKHSKLDSTPSRSGKALKL